MLAHDGEQAAPSAVIHKGKKEFKMVGNYMMGEVIGEGTQGKVRQALHSETLRRVAIKIVHIRQLRKVRNAEESMRREMAIHRRLKHRNVVELIEDFRIEEKEKWYVVLELVTGGSLQDILDASPETRMSDTHIRRFILQLLEGLDYCHSKGVVHRDIKPSNLMVNTDGVLKICDFGVAEELNTFEQEDNCTKSRGSPAFQPPEVASGSHERFSGFKVDVWATGISLFLLATGSVPFEGTSLINLFENIAKGEFEVPECLQAKPQLLRLVRSMLAHDQTARASVKEALADAWLNEQGEDDDGAWTDADKALVQSISVRSRSSTVLRAIARMYGEEFIEETPQGESQRVQGESHRGAALPQQSGDGAARADD
mmetsp:Transcript_35600/g.74767  ORF Transcript_35600/g.74767 Transcript_35600/m.74767 type:complete len:371 (-) Transcript_35600:14-1126(-)